MEKNNAENIPYNEPKVKILQSNILNKMLTYMVDRIIRFCWNVHILGEDSLQYFRTPYTDTITSRCNNVKNKDISPDLTHNNNTRKFTMVTPAIMITLMYIFLNLLGLIVQSTRSAKNIGTDAPKNVNNIFPKTDDFSDSL